MFSLSVIPPILCGYYVKWCSYVLAFFPSFKTNQVKPIKTAGLHPGSRPRHVGTTVDAAISGSVCCLCASLKTKIKPKTKTAGLRPGSRHPFCGLTKRVQKAAKLVLAHRITLLPTRVLMARLRTDCYRPPLGWRMVRFFSSGVERFSAVMLWRPLGAHFHTSEPCRGLSERIRFAAGGKNSLSMQQALSLITSLRT